MGMVVNYAPGKMCKQMVPAHRKVRTFPHVVWGMEEDLKYQNNQSADEEIDPGISGWWIGGADHHTVTFIGWILRQRFKIFFSTNCAESYIQLNIQANEVIKLYTADC